MTAGHLYEESAAAIAEARRGAERPAKCPLLGKARVRADGNLYEPDEAGDAAWIFPVLARSHICAGPHVSTDPTPRDLAGAPVPLVDLAAWRPSQPGTVLLRRGAVPMLGWDIDAADSGEVLQLWASPMSWAAADFRGLVVLDWASVAVRLLDWREIVAETLGLGERLQAELDKARRRLTPKRPRVSIREAAI